MNMTVEQRTITVTAYRDSGGNPTCAVDFGTNAACTYYRTARFGCCETCVHAEATGNSCETMARRDKGHGSLIPLKACPVWRGADSQQLDDSGLVQELEKIEQPDSVDKAN